MKRKIMDAVSPSEFEHTTLKIFPSKIVGVTLLDEEPGFTGIYLRDGKGGLWPARTVSHNPPEHHRSVCESWMARPGVNEDKRAIRGS
jgi:hypothetical protein